MFLFMPTLSLDLALACLSLSRSLARSLLLSLRYEDYTFGTPYGVMSQSICYF